MSSFDNRCRTWAFIVYPDSAPENWREVLDEQHISWVESPLHDQDINEGTGEVKKPHWHVVISFSGVKTYEQVLEIISPLNCPIPQRCHSVEGAVRYMAHLDNPDKAQYDPLKIVGHGGFDVSKALAPTSSKRYELIDEMQEFCFNNVIVEFSDLCNYARSERRSDWWPLLCDSSAVIMEKYLRSLRFKLQGR